MATWLTGTVNNTTYTGGSSWNATRTIAAGSLVIFCISWEDSQTLSSVSDTAGGVWAIATQDNDGAAPAPIGAIAYCLNHPGGTNVVITGTLTGAANPILEADILCFAPTAGFTFQLDGVATPGKSGGTLVTTFTAGNITTTGAGVVVQFLAGFQITGGVSAGGTPTFTRDTATENNGVGRCFAQYLISGSAQTVTPGASWGSAPTEYVLMAAAFKEVPAGASNAIAWIKA